MVGKQLPQVAAAAVDAGLVPLTVQLLRQNQGIRISKAFHGDVLRLPDLGGGILQSSPPVIGCVIPLRQASVSPGSRQQHRQDTGGEHAEQRQRQEALHMRFFHGLFHSAPFRKTVISGIRLEANTW